MMTDDIETARLIAHKKVNAADVVSSKVHLLPCKIKYEGPANVKDYFDSTIEKRDDGKYEARLRGRVLRSSGETSLPSGVSGAVIRREGSNKESWVVEKTFDSVTVWGHDSVSKDDCTTRALSWIDLSSAIHG